MALTGSKSAGAAETPPTKTGATAPAGTSTTATTCMRRQKAVGIPSAVGPVGKWERGSELRKSKYLFPATMQPPASGTESPSGIPPLPPITSVTPEPVAPGSETTTPQPPSKPLDLRFRASKASDGSNRVDASWSLPSSNGDSPITGYTVRFSRPGNSNVATRTLAATQRSLGLTGAWANTTYTVTVTVTATNIIGTSAPATNTVTTPTTPPSTSRRPTSTPIITGIEWHKSRFQKDEDVSITWNTSSVKGADNYRFEYRYVTYPRKTFGVGNVSVTIPDIFGEPALPDGQIVSSKEPRETCKVDVNSRTCRYRDVYIEDNVEMHHWNLQFRVIPLSGNTRGTASNWTNFSDGNE